jgi:hypothetical protein
MLAGRRRAIRERPSLLIAARSATVASAAEAAGVTITAKNVRQFDPKKDGDPLGWVISKNLKRRHLDESQRAWVAAKNATLPRGGDHQSANWHFALVAIDEAGVMLNVSPRSIKRANAVRDHGMPELQHAVEQGHLAVSLAANAAKMSPEDQIEIVARAGNGEVNLVRYRAMNCHAPPGEAVIRCRPARPSP